MAISRSVFGIVLCVTACGSAADTALTQEKIKWALDALSDLEESQTTTNDALASVEDRVLALEHSTHAQLPTPNWINCDETPSLPQELYNQGAKRLLVEKASYGSPQGCAKLVIDRHPVAIVSGGLDIPFEEIEVSNSAVVLSDIWVGRLTAFDSKVVISDSGANEVVFENANVLYVNSFVSKAEAIGSTIEVSLDFGGLGDLNLKRSDLSGSGLIYRSRLVLFPGSTIDFGDDPAAILPLALGADSTVTCDPEQSRIYDPLHRMQTNVLFYPPAYDEDTCLVHASRPD